MAVASRSFFGRGGCLVVGELRSHLSPGAVLLLIGCRLREFSCTESVSQPATGEIFLVNW